ncbi:MAG: glycosyltransferase [Candidatus Coproplasma sp.]
MKILFCQGGSRIKFNSKNELFVDGNFNNSVFSDYCKLADEVTFLLRSDPKKYDDNTLEVKFNKLDSKFNVHTVPDVYASLKSRFNLIKNAKIKKEIEELVKNSDKVIIRSLGNFYTNTVLKFCKKHKKSYLVEVTGFAFDGLWYHSWKGKMVALPRELYLKRQLKKAKYALYVTEEALQKRYPCKGKTLGCSDVRLNKADSQILENRLKKLTNTSNDKIVLGTAAFLDVKWKGQLSIIKALAQLKKQGICNYEYQLIGSGKGEHLKKAIERYGLQDNVKILGAMPHNKVFEWLDTIDIYVQPSYQEGLCRAIVEAMSRACPVICSDVGGNYELIERKFIFKKADVKSFINCLLSMDKSAMQEEAKLNFNKSLAYDKDKLEEKRQLFYKNFAEE